MKARALVAALLVILATGTADAHKLSVKRTLLLEPSGRHDLQILLQLRVPSGESRRFDWAVFINEVGVPYV